MITNFICIIIQNPNLQARYALKVLFLLNPNSY